jgi:DNA-binding NtrC family response regulator
VPNAVRLILTGYSDEELMISAIRYAYIFDYIRKPYDPDDVQIRLEKALNQYQENIKRAREEHSSQKAYNMVKGENEKLKSILLGKNIELEALKKEHSDLKQNIIGIAEKGTLKKAS